MRISDMHTDAVTFSTIGEMSDPHVIARFTVPGDPVTKSRARWNSKQRRTYTPAKTVAAEAAVLAEYLKAANPAHRKDAQSTFGVMAIFFLRPGLVRRDVDNMIKLLLDALNGWAWADDSQVTEVVGRKVSAFPADDPRTEVLIYRTGSVRPRGVEMTCENCRQSFHVPPSVSARGKRFCSNECHIEWRRRERSRTCEECGQTFETRSASAKFCSNDCRYAAARIDATCIRCGLTFKKPRHLNRSGNSYCSDECKETYWREQRKSAAKGTCDDCGGPTAKRDYKRCRDCHYAAGGRWADRDAATCPICHSFVADGQRCARDHGSAA